MDILKINDLAYYFKSKCEVWFWIIRDCPCGMAVLQWPLSPACIACPDLSGNRCVANTITYLGTPR